MTQKMSRAWVLLGLMSVVLTLSSGSRAQSGWFNLSWLYRNPITISNSSGSNLTNFQVKITLNGSSFNFAQAKSNGSDIRMTAGDGTTQIPFWIETWNATTQMASIWVQVPSVPTSGTTIYLYYGNSSASSASNGNATFLFFDDFDSAPQGQGYWTLGSQQTELVQSQAWESTAPHTLSVLPLNMGGYTYWGYYGLQDTCGGVGLAFSNDLVTWTKYTNNPLFTNGRWPRVIQVGNTLYMAYTANYCTDSQINLASSTDGLNWTPVKTLVPAFYGGLSRNQNPDLWLNPNDGKYYLYWYSGDGTSVFNIMGRSATSPTALDDPSADTVVLNSSQTLAAPDMMYYSGTYFLSTEIVDNNGWAVRVYSSTTGPTSGFSALPGNPVLNNGAACMFQTRIGTTLHEYYCQLTGNTWTLQHRQADITSTRPIYTNIDSAKWTASGGTWSAIADTEPTGTTGFVAQGNTSGDQILYSSFTGSNYVLEAFGKQLQGRVWGLGFRVKDPTHFYTLNLYDNLDPSPNLYSYRWSNGNATSLGNAAVGPVNPSTWYKLGVRAQDGSFDFYKDGVFQFHTADSSYASGGVALYGEGGSVANFDNVLVRQYALVDPTSTIGPQQTATPSLSSLSLNPVSVTGGSVNSTGTITLTLGAPSGGAIVTLTSSNTAAATVPASVTVPAGATSATFTVTSKSVATASSSTITASYNTTQSATLTVTPAANAVASITLNPTTVAGGASPTATINLNGTAPAGGTVVTLASSNTTAATVPPSLTIPANAGSGTFTVTSAAVSSTTTVTITATFGGSQTATLTVTAPSAQSLTLNPTSLIGGSANSTGTVTLSSPAPSGGAAVALSSNNTSAATVPPSVSVPAGATTANFTVTSKTVNVVVTVSITATYNGTTTATLTVNPAPGPGTAAFVRAAGNFGASPSYSVSIAPNAGDFLAVFVWQEEGGTTPTVTDNLSSAYIRDCDLTYNQGFGLRRLTVYHLVNIPSGITGVSVSPSQRSRTIVSEYSGMTATAALDVCGTVNNQTSVSSWSSTATTTTTKDLIFGLADTGLSGSTGYAASGAWSRRLEQGDPIGRDDSFVEDQLNVAAGSYTAAGTTSSPVTESSVVVAFKTQ